VIEAAFLKSLHSATRISNSLRRGCKGTSFLNKKRSFGGGPRSFLVTFRFAQIMLCSAISDEFTVNLKGHLILFTATPDPGIFLYWNVEKNDLDFTHAPPNASLPNYISGVTNDSLASPPVAAGYLCTAVPLLLCGSVAVSFNDNSW